MQPDLSQLSDEELLALAQGGKASAGVLAAPTATAPDLSKMSEAQLQTLAKGGRVQTGSDEFFNYYSDGSKALRVDITKSPRAAATVAAEQMAESPWNNTAGAFAVAAGDGLMMGAGDEALASSPEELALLHAKKLYLRDNYPIPSLVGNVAGSVASFLPVGRLASMAAKGVGLGLKGIQAANAGAGILQGAVAGALDNNEDRGAGAVLGGLFSLAGEGAGAYLGSKIAARTKGAPSQQDTMIAGAMSDPAAARGILTEAERLGLPVTMADADTGIAALAGQSAARSGQARALANNVLDGRDAEAVNRAVATIDAKLAQETDVMKLGKSLRSEGSAKADPFYKAAYAQPAPVNDPVIRDLFNRPSVVEALRLAKQSAAENGENWDQTVGVIGPRGGFTFKKGATFETLDKVKRGLDDYLGQFRNPVTGKLDTSNGTVRDVIKTRDAFVARMKEINPDYRKALEEYAPFGVRAEALERGAKAVSVDRLNPKQVAEITANMTPDELAAFQIGAANKIIDMIRRPAEHADTFKPFTGEDMKLRLQAIFPDKADALADLTSQTQLEKIMRATRETVIKGSQTQPRQMASRAFDAAAEAGSPGILARATDVAAAVATSGVSLLPQLVRSGRLKASEAAKLETVQNQAKLAEDLAPILLETDPKKARVALDNILSNVKRYEQKKQRVIGTGTSVGAAAGAGILAQQ